MTIILCVMAEKKSLVSVAGQRVMADMCSNNGYWPDVAIMAGYLWRRPHVLAYIISVVVTMKAWLAICIFLRTMAW